MDGRHLFIVVLYTTASLSSAWCNEINITVQQSEGYPESCEQEGLHVACPDLDSAITFTTTLTSVDALGQNTSLVTISLPKGTHLVTTVTYFGSTSVSFVGLESDVFVVCDYYADENATKPLETFTWYFDELERVEMTNLNFGNCGFPFRLSGVRDVVMENCTFRNFSEAVLDIYNCAFTQIDSVYLCDNHGTDRLREPYRGNSGGIAIGYNLLPGENDRSITTITNSVFVRNEARGFITPERAVTSEAYRGRGGGIGIYLNETYTDIVINVTDCIFEHNKAAVYGGAFYFVSSSYPTVQHIINLERCHFSDNDAPLGSGAISLSYFGTANESRQHSFVVKDTNFTRNFGEAGGAFYGYIDQNNHLIRLENCIFLENGGTGKQTDFGAALGLSYAVRFTQRVTSTRQEIVNCSFIRNSGPNGILSIGYTPVKFSGVNRFVENTGSSLRIVGSLVEFEGQVEFTNNTGNSEAALYLLSFGQISLVSGVNFIFQGNTGKLGASIIVDTLVSIASFDDLLFNPRCFILYHNRTATPDEWEASFIFRENEAIISSAIYILQRGEVCSWFKRTPPFFNNTYTRDWPIWHYENNRNTGFLDDNQLYSFGTSAQQFALELNEMRAWPGEKVPVSLVSLDDFQSHTSTSARFIYQPGPLATMENISATSLRFAPQIIVLADAEDGQLESSFLFSYGVKSPDLLASEITSGGLGAVVAEEAFNPHPVVSDNFTLFPLPCPSGYALTNMSNTDSMTCSCVTDSEEILFCEADEEYTIVLRYGTWAIYNRPADPTRLNLVFFDCPAGYCSCTFNSSLSRQQHNTGMTCLYQYRQSDPDSQCVCDRQGTLCGKCREDGGVSVLLNKCVTCSDGYLALILPLVAVIVVALVIIVLLDKPVMEWLIPFLFYLHNAPYATEFFPETFEVVGKYIRFLSSATSFYFPYDFCLSSNLSAAHSYLLRYLPPLVATVVLCFVWLIRRKILKRKTLINHGCWWCILLMFSSVTHTSMSALHCVSVPHNGTSTSRWFLDGEMECFSGAHVPLGLLAILMLLVCIFTIALVAVLPSMTRSLFKNYKEPFACCYKDDLYWWSGVELARRFIFLLALIPFPRNTVFAILVLVLSLSLYAYNLPYKSKVANCLEILVQLNLLSLLVLELTSSIRDELFVFPLLTEAIGGVCSNMFSRVSDIVALLGPVYYAPVLLFVVVAAIYLTLLITRTWKECACKQEKDADQLERTYTEVRAPNYTSQTIDIGYSQSIVSMSEEDKELKD